MKTITELNQKFAEFQQGGPSLSHSELSLLLNKTKEVMGFMDYIGCFTMCEYLVDMAELIQAVIKAKEQVLSRK